MQNSAVASPHQGVGMHKVTLMLTACIWSTPKPSLLMQEHQTAVSSCPTILRIPCGSRSCGGHRDVPPTCPSGRICLSIGPSRVFPESLHHPRHPFLAWPTQVWKSPAFQPAQDILWPHDIPSSKEAGLSWAGLAPTLSFSVCPYFTSCSFHSVSS